eukprot:2321032-Lingulodinium_polyedra.AAC.1
MGRVAPAGAAPCASGDCGRAAPARRVGQWRNALVVEPEEEPYPEAAAAGRAPGPRLRVVAQLGRRA